MEETPFVETIVEETPPEETIVEETPPEETIVEGTPPEETIVEETPPVETIVEETPSEETIVNDEIFFQPQGSETRSEDRKQDDEVDGGEGDNRSEGQGDDSTADAGQSPTGNFPPNVAAPFTPNSERTSNVIGNRLVSVLETDTTTSDRTQTVRGGSPDPGGSLDVISSPFPRITVFIGVGVALCVIATIIGTVGEFYTRVRV